MLDVRVTDFVPFEVSSIAETESIMLDKLGGCVQFTPFSCKDTAREGNEFNCY